MPSLVLVLAMILLAACTTPAETAQPSPLPPTNTADTSTSTSPPATDTPILPTPTEISTPAIPEPGYPLTLTINAKSNALTPGKNTVEMPLRPGKYQVKLDSQMTIQGQAVTKAVIYATTDGMPYGWFWVVEAGVDNQITLNGKGTQSDRLFAFLLAAPGEQMEGQMTLTFTSSELTKQASLAAKNAIDPSALAAPLRLPPGRYQLSLRANAFMTGKMPLKKVILFASAANGLTWMLDDRNPQAIDLPQGYPGVLYGLILDIGAKDNSGSSLVTITQAAPAWLSPLSLLPAPPWRVNREN